MAELDKSVKFMPPYKIVEMIRREEKKVVVIFEVISSQQSAIIRYYIGV